MGCSPRSRRCSAFMALIVIFAESAGQQGDLIADEEVGDGDLLAASRLDSG